MPHLFSLDLFAAIALAIVVAVVLCLLATPFAFLIEAAWRSAIAMIRTPFAAAGTAALIAYDALLLAVLVTVARMIWLRIGPGTWIQHASCTSLRPLLRGGWTFA